MVINEDGSDVECEVEEEEIEVLEHSLDDNVKCVDPCLYSFYLLKQLFELIDDSFLNSK